MLSARFAAIALLFSVSSAAAAEVQALLRRMTLDEKLSLMHGARDPRQLGQAGYWPGLPRLGIPPLRLADGPPGVNVTRDATCMPAPVSLAATFSREAARAYGLVLGRDARALQQDVLLAPHVNIVRDPLFRRNHTTLSEDPFLTAQLAAAEIAGIQSQGVLAQVKHLAGYNGPDAVEIDERTLNEIYLPAFEAAVKAGVASVMCAYNAVNGARACENPELQNRILRERWGFRGFVTSDWGAVHSPLAILTGVDLEMPGREIAGRKGGPYFTEALRAAVAGGQVPVSAIDGALLRILGQMDRFHLLDRKPAGPVPAIDAEADAKIVREIAEQGAVLLKNNGEALPLTAGDLASLAVIGPTAGQLAAGSLGERAYGFESRLVAPLAALRRLAPAARIVYAVGDDLTGVPLPASLTLKTEGDYTFLVQTATGHGPAGGSISIDGRLVVRSGGLGLGGAGMVVKKWSSLLPTLDGRDNARATVHLAAGAHTVETASQAEDGTPDVRFAWITPEMRRANLEAAVSAARSARTAVVFAWKGMGGTFDLPGDQDELIRRVAAVNQRTIVVLNTGGPVAMPWKDEVRAILEMWYPGQEGGWATADLLLGNANPSGRLPVTFPVRLEPGPARSTEVFSEGLAVGYRWYDQQKIEPLFAFGHGLSYTSFEYSGLSVRRAGGGVDVMFSVRNAGSRKGAEVPQVYLGPARDRPVSMMPRSLAGFERIELAAGESKRVTIHVDARAFSYWSVDQHEWVLAAGDRNIYAGPSSRDIALSTTQRLMD